MMKIKLYRSPNDRLPDHRNTVKGLGLRRTLGERLVVDTPASRGAVKKVSYLVKILEDGIPAEKAKGLSPAGKAYRKTAKEKRKLIPPCISTPFNTVCQA